MSVHSVCTSLPWRFNYLLCVTADLGQTLFWDFDLVHIKWGFSLLCSFCCWVNPGSTDQHPVSNLPVRTQNSLLWETKQNRYWLFFMYTSAVCDKDLFSNGKCYAHHYLCGSILVFLHLINNCTKWDIACVARHVNNQFRESYFYYTIRNVFQQYRSWHLCCAIPIAH